MSDDGNGRIKVNVQVVYAVLAVVGWIVSGWVGYESAQSAMNARVSVLESQFQQLHTDIQDIRTDVKTLLGRK